jgi:hypothetical protein
MAWCDYPFQLGLARGPPDYPLPTDMACLFILFQLVWTVYPTEIGLGRISNSNWSGVIIQFKMAWCDYSFQLGLARWLD